MDTHMHVHMNTNADHSTGQRNIVPFNGAVIPHAHLTQLRAQMYMLIFHVSCVICIHF